MRRARHRMTTGWTMSANSDSLRLMLRIDAAISRNRMGIVTRANYWPRHTAATVDA